MQPILPTINVFFFDRREDGNNKFLQNGGNKLPVTTCHISVECHLQQHSVTTSCYAFPNANQT